MNENPPRKVIVVPATAATAAATQMANLIKAQAKARAKAKATEKPRAKARIQPYLQDKDTAWFVYNASLPEVERRARLRGSPVIHFSKGIEVITAIGWCLFARMDQRTVFCRCKTTEEAANKAHARAKARAPTTGSSGPKTFTVSLVPRRAQ